MGYDFGAKLAIHTATPLTARFEFVSEALQLREELINTSGITGDRETDISRIKPGPQRVGGPIVMQPTPVELALLLPWIYGAAASGTNYPLGDTLTSRYVMIERVTDAYLYTGTLVDKATFSVSESSPVLQLTLDTVAVSETASQTFPSLSIDTTTSPFIFSELVVEVAGTAYAIREWSMTVDNQVDRNRFLNSLTLHTGANATGRVITTRIVVPHTLGDAIYGAGEGGVRVQATFTDGNVSLDLDMTKCAFPRESPVVKGRSEGDIILNGTAYAVAGSTASLITTLDSTVGA